MADLTHMEKKELLALTRNTIKKYLTGGERADPPLDKPVFMEKRGVFVTLHRNGELRGCIGYPLPYKPLGEAVVDNAIAAATEDPRFPAVTSAELGELDIEISVLTVPQKVAGPDQVQVGRDGIIISKGFQRGLLLPQVPVEQGWDLEQYISYGCRKAGLAPDEWERGVQIEVFQAAVFGEREMGEEP
ncbi:MAG: AmmeMemoRadiSam system protein A [Acidobacteria bacterium]|nr:AmmeMemoRadiSam system protein A [Acidobacteriota bacterium]MBU4405066.1 AmmeMemoRadiSam system protein A [Acidobacteriota bacterium]MCG2811684.1 AmmeMemoRadiSam system protein A [Candidatus Aminicenantes bacterium]